MARTFPFRSASRRPTQAGRLCHPFKPVSGTKYPSRGPSRPHRLRLPAAMEQRYLHYWEKYSTAIWESQELSQPVATQIVVGSATASVAPVGVPPTASLRFLPSK